MNRGQSKSPKISLINRSADYPFFYDNLQFRQALETLRFGIETEKGLILLTGESGVGKTTLLHKLTSKLEPNVTCIWVSDPYCDFSEIIRLILHRFGVDAGADGESAMTERCLEILRSRRDNDLMIALIFDNAHHLGNQSLEPVIKYLLEGPARRSESSLGQIVLSGRPELKDKLLQPEFRKAGFPIGVEYELAILQQEDLHHYVEQRLRFGGLPANSFSRAAVQLIAAHSGGRLKIVNAICDRALETGADLSRKPISAKVIAAVIKDLDPHQPRMERKKETELNFAAQQERADPYYLIFDNDTTEAVDQPLLNYNNYNYSSQRTKSLSNRGWFPVLIMLLFVLGAADSLNQFEPIKRYAKEWSETVTQAADLNRPTAPVQANSVAELKSTSAPPTESGAPPTETKSLLANSNNDAATDRPTSETKDSVEPTPSVTLKTPGSDRTKPPPQIASKTRRSPPDSAKGDTGPTSRELAIKVSKAIENRAITGIEVAVIDNVAYLDGRVTSETQRKVVERAAREVPQIHAVRNRIVVD